MTRTNNAHSDKAKENEGNSVSPQKRQILIDLARRVLLVIVFAAALYFIVTNWAQVQETVASLEWWQLSLSLLALIPGVLLGMLMWRVVMVGILRSRHISSEGKSLNQIYLVGQIGKYLPGSVWAFVLQMELGRKNGIARAQVFVASLISTGVTVGASLVVGSMALPLVIAQQPSLQWLYIILPFVLLAMNPRVVTFLVNVTLKVLRRPPLPERIRAATMIQSFALGVAMYCFYGLHLWILVAHETALSLESLMLLTGALSLGMTAGVLAFLLPAGVGAREFVLFIALAGMMTGGAATAIAALSRIMFTVADLLCVSVAFIKITRPPRTQKASVDG